LILVEKELNKIGLELVRLSPKIPFDKCMVSKPVIARSGKMKGKIKRYGYGWPRWDMRWCTTFKRDTIKKCIKENFGNKYITYIGIAKDEENRVKIANNILYPLITWGMTEKDCLDYCYSLGYNWGGLYDKMDRVSCFCCPFQRVSELEVIFNDFPELWQNMLDFVDANSEYMQDFKSGKPLEYYNKKFSEKKFNRELTKKMAYGK